MVTSPAPVRAFQVPTRQQRAAAKRHRPGPAPRPGFARCCEAIAGVGLGVVIGSVVLSESRGALAAPGGLITAVGRVSGFIGAYAMLVMVILIARLPWLERSVGQDRLLRWHRRSAPWAMGLILTHVATVTIGYAALGKASIPSQFWAFLSSYPDMLAALVGLLLLVMASVSSIRIARRKMKYESWWIVHLYTYLGLTLVFMHQIRTGASFLSHPLARALWLAVWLFSGALVFSFRWLLPIAKNLRHRLKVASIAEEAPGVYSIICTGRHLDRLGVSGGQFFQWRFLARGMWWQAHPFSISALPRPPFLRLTVKALGDQSAALSSLPIGTRVMIEGPYGAFTHHSRTSDRVALIGAGIGVTPIRSMLEDLPRDIDVVTIVRAHAEADLIHHEEITALSRERNAQLIESLGSRHEVPLDAAAVKSMVPDIAGRDVYVCGPDGFTHDMIDALRRNRVPMSQIHVEAFAF